MKEKKNLGARRGSQGRPGPPQPDTFLCRHRGGGGGRGPAVVSCSNKKKNKRQAALLLSCGVCVCSFSHLVPLAAVPAGQLASDGRGKHVCQTGSVAPTHVAACRAVVIQPVWWAACTECSRLAVLCSVCEARGTLRQRVSYNHYEREKWLLDAWECQVVEVGMFLGEPRQVSGSRSVICQCFSLH